MRCPNIIIISHFLADLEVKNAVDMLKKRYGDRQVIPFTFNPWQTEQNVDNLAALAKQHDQIKFSDTTGVYVIGHGSKKTGFISPVNTPAGATALAETLLGFFKLGFTIKKICVIVCGGVYTRNKAPTKVPTPEAQETSKIYVQNLCRALSDKADPKQLDGLMVAGYTSAVFLFNPKEDERKNEPFPERLEGRRVGSKSFVKQEPASSLMRPAGDPPPWIDYAKRKIVFIFKNKDWTLGKLSEYTDKAELRSALSVNGL